MLHCRLQLRLLDPNGYLDHRRALSWGAIRCTDSLYLDNLDLISRCSCA